MVVYNGKSWIGTNECDSVQVKRCLKVVSQ